MKKVLSSLFSRRKLDRLQAREVLVNIAEGKYNDAQIAAFITVYLMRSITVDELTGFRDALLDLCVKTDLSEFDPIDLCGTGGDGKDTFNISTLASFVTAGAGANVAKHGNYGVSSICGIVQCVGIFRCSFYQRPGQIAPANGSFRLLHDACTAFPSGYENRCSDS